MHKKGHTTLYGEFGNNLNDAQDLDVTAMTACIDGCHSCLLCKNGSKKVLKWTFKYHTWINMWDFIYCENFLVHL